MDPRRTTGHNATTGKDTVATYAEKRRGDSAIGSPRQGDIYNHAQNDQIGSVDCTETPRGRGKIGICHGTNTYQGTI
jgi:hypothetical protein